MARGRLVLYVAPPGFRSALEFARVFAGTEGSILTSSANSLLVNLHQAIAQDDDTLAKIEAGSLEVLPFNELLRRLASASGAPLFPILSLEYQRALMALACQTIPEHSELAPVKAIPGFHEGLLQIARELRHYRIPLDALRLLGKRTSEVADVLSHYRQILWEHKVGTLSDRIEVLLDYPLQAPATLENIFWCGETEVPPLWCEGINWLLDGGVNVHFLIETHLGREDFFFLPHERQELFSGAEVRNLDVPVPKAGKVFSLKDFPTLDGRVEILEAVDGITECEWAMRAVLGFLREGVKPGEVGIFCRSLSDYAPYLYSAGRRLGLTLKMEYKQKLLSNPFVGTVVTALRACLPDGWRLLPLLLQSPYGDTPPVSWGKAEEMLLSCGQSDAPWRALAQMQQEHPDLLPPWLGGLAKWREFAHSFRGTLGDWCQLLSRLLGMMPWLDASLRSGTPTVDRDLSAQDAMIRSLRASTASVPPDTRFSLSEFATFVEQVWRDAEYTLRYRGEIPVVTEAMALGDVQWVIALGVAEGRFPKRRMEVPILNDEKREALTQQNPQWRLPTSYDRAREEEQEFYRLVCSAPNILLCYPHKILDHHEVPAFFLSDLQESVPGVKHSCKPLEQRFPLPAECLHSADLFPSLEWYRDSIPEEVRAWEQRLSEEQGRQRERFRLSAQNSQSHELQDEELRRRFSVLPRSLTFSLLRSLARCPFQYFARAHLSFSATRPARIGRRLDRLVQKVDLVNVRSPEELRDALVRALDEEMEKTKAFMPPEVWELLRLSGQALLEDFSRREFHAREEWGLVPEKQNLSLQQAGFRTAVKVQGLDLTLDEHIDILYRRGEDVVPLRLGYAPTGSDRESFRDNALLLALMPQPKEERISLVDDLEGRRRLAIAGARSGQASQLSEKPDGGLLVGRRDHSSKLLVDEAKKHLQEVVQMAISGDITPTPGTHCTLCSLGSLCRRAQNSTLIDPRYDSLPDEGVFGGVREEGVAE